MQQQFGLRIGSIVTVPFYSAAQRGRRFHQRLPHPTRSPGELPCGRESRSAKRTFPPLRRLTRFTPARRSIVVGSDTVVRRISSGAAAPGPERHAGAADYVNHHQPKSGFAYMQNEDSSAASIAQSIQPQATGLVVLRSLRAAGWTGLGGPGVVAPEPRRARVLSDALRDRAPSPTALWTGHGPRRGHRSRWGLGGGGAGLRRLAPHSGGRGSGRRARPGIRVQPGPVRPRYSRSIVAVVSAWRRCRRGARPKAASRGSRVTSRCSRSNAAVALVARTGAPPSILVGVRNALDRGRGRSSVPVATALVGATVAVMALVATTVFGASLNHLVKTPPLYGQNWQLDLGSMTTPQVAYGHRRFDDDPARDQGHLGFRRQVREIGSVVVQGVFVDVAKGPMAFSLVNGHDPVGTHQMVLGVHDHVPGALARRIARQRVAGQQVRQGDGADIRGGRHGRHCRRPSATAASGWGPCCLFPRPWI